MKTAATFILSLTAIVTLAAGSAFGAYSGGTGEPNNPYKIAAKADLLALAANTADYGKCFTLTADVNLQGQVFSNAIIASDASFTGTFNGNGHKISNFTINGGSNDYLGLFGFVDTDGLVENLGIENFAVSGTSCLGGLAGWNFGNISNCYSTGTVSGTSFAGGLVGLSDNGNIGQCYSMSAVSGDGWSIGGLVGRNYNAGINNCYSAGKVSSSAGSLFVGGLVGSNDSGSVLGSFWDMNTSGQKASSGGEGKTTTEMKMLLTFTSAPASWDFTNETANGTNDYWRMCVDGGYYPHFKWEYSPHGDFECPDGTDFYDLTIFVDQWLLEKLAQDTSLNGGDGIVNFIDWATFADKWQGDMMELADFASQWLKLSAYCADIAPAPGGDGVVNFVDFAMFAENWLQP
ncbi:MAG: hypothetical protein NTW55_05295 [Planctomycetota bacterium]|nr:hypothetical protein [Planctomycetota bacterium]